MQGWTTTTPKLLDSARWATGISKGQHHCADSFNHLPLQASPKAKHHEQRAPDLVHEADERAPPALWSGGSRFSGLKHGGARRGRVLRRFGRTGSSGLKYDEGSLPWTDDTLTYYGTDLRKVALSAKIADSPGETFRYNNYNLLLEGLILERATGQSVTAYLSSRLWKPMGADATASWSLDSAGSGFEKMESGLNALARDFARFGVLFARGGHMNGRQVVPRIWVEQATSRASHGGPANFYGFHWWTGTEKGAALPPGHFCGVGNLGQFVYVVPARDLVIVRLGDAWGFVGWLDLLSQVAEGM